MQYHKKGYSRTEIPHKPFIYTVSTNPLVWQCFALSSFPRIRAVLIHFRISSHCLQLLPLHFLFLFLPPFHQTSFTFNLLTSLSTKLAMQKFSGRPMAMTHAVMHLYIYTQFSLSTCKAVFQSVYICSSIDSNSLSTCLYPLFISV